MADVQDEDMYLFQAGLEQTPSAFAGQDFDAFLTSSATEADQEKPPDGFLNPNDLSVKRERAENSPASGGMRFAQSHRGSGSSSSSSEYPNYHNRNVSEVSAASTALHAEGQASWGSGIKGFSMPANEHFFEDAPMTGLDADFEASNQQMASDFDFETAASTPSGFDHATTSTFETNGSVQPFRRTTNFANFGHGKNSSTNLPISGQPSFFFAGSREASPLNAMLPTAQGQSPWSKHSPSSGLEETFNHITMNGDSPGNATFSPNLNFPGAGFSFDPESSNTPSTFTKDISSPPSTINSADGVPHLTVHPTSLKSRVETQIPIKLTLTQLPPGATRLRLPTHTVSKPKFLAKPEVEKSADILELQTSLVCTSAMQDPVRLDRALARARGEELAQYARPSPASSTTSSSSRDDEDKPLNGGEVRICTGCIQRERKRASRKKQKKPEEEEMFQKDEEKRVVVFNTNEVKDWVEVSKDSQSTTSSGAESQLHVLPGAMQVELPMRIACYCRHQNEKMGFQVIFTIKDSHEKVIAQAMTNPIMITDDHKTHNAPPSIQNAPASLPSAPQLPGAGVFSTSGNDNAGVPGGPKVFKQSFSTTDLQGLQHNFNPNFPMAPSSNPFATPVAVSNNTSTTLTPKNLSRPASPNGPMGPTTKRRKQSGSGKLPTGLTMTRLDTSQGFQGPATMPNTAASSPYAPNMNSYMAPNDRAFAMAPSRPNPFGTSPPTPNGNDAFGANINRSFSLENLPRQNMMSAPPSRQPSRPGSPGSARNSFSAADPNFGQAVSNQLMGQPSRRPPPLIHKLVPAEGSVTGGTEVTLLGNGFYQGLEVMFGDTEATTTTFWGEKCLNCIAPPALQPGVVVVIFKHEHPQYSSMQPQSQTRPSVFTYTDDRELELFRIALRSIGKQMQHPTDDPYNAAQQLIGQQQALWPSHGKYGMGSGQQRHAGVGGGAQLDTLELEHTMVQMLEFLGRKGDETSVLNLHRPSGLTLLHLAASLGLTRFVAAILARGANPNSVDKNGHTPMHHAAMNGHTYIIHRLRLAGASHKIRSIWNLTPADVATSLLSYQAALTPAYHYRSRSVGGTPMRLHSRNASASSLRSFWENASSAYLDSDSDDLDGDEADDEDLLEISRDAISQQSLPQAGPGIPAVALTAPRQGNEQQVEKSSISFPSQRGDAGPNSAASAFMLAWRDHLVAQLHQFNESAQSVMPNLGTVNGPLQALQDYQAYPMVRRVSSLFPQRPGSRQAGSGSREGWWETLTGSSSPAPSAPPAYGDLYPEEATSEIDWSLKKDSAMQAATDVAADLHFEAESFVHAEASKSRELEPAPKNPLSSKREIHRIELSHDRKLFFFWIPILAILLALMIRNSGVLQLVPRAQGIFEAVGERQVVEVV